MSTRLFFLERFGFDLEVGDAFLYLQFFVGYWGGLMVTAILFFSDGDSVLCCNIPSWFVAIARVRSNAVILNV
jgi:hypothetical protein